MALKINENGVDRDMTAEEEAAHLAYQKIAQDEAESRAEAQAAKDAARQIVLDKLGLTQDEAQALLG